MKVLKVIGTIGRFALAGVLIAGHFVMNIIGALICAITSQGYCNKRGVPFRSKYSRYSCGHERFEELRCGSLLRRR